MPFRPTVEVTGAATLLQIKTPGLPGFQFKDLLAMIAIVNVDENVRTGGPHKYELRINRKVVATFTHDREKPLRDCLLAAALAAEEAGPNHNFQRPRYDDVFFAGLEALSKM
jgi:hypothetical protein